MKGKIIFLAGIMSLLVLSFLGTVWLAGTKPAHLPAFCASDAVMLAQYLAWFLLAMAKCRFRFDYREPLYTIDSNVADELQLVVFFCKEKSSGECLGWAERR